MVEILPRHWRDTAEEIIFSRQQRAVHDKRSLSGQEIFPFCELWPNASLHLISGGRSRVRCWTNWPDELLIRHILLQLGTGFSDEELEEHHQSLQVGRMTARHLSSYSVLGLW